MSQADAEAKSSSQGPFFIWHGMKLWDMARLLSKRPPIDSSAWLKLLLMPPMGAYNSLMALAERAVYGRRIEQTQVNDSPVFVIGFWRSGTTLLHNLFCNDPQFAFFNTYETLFPWHFLLTEDVGVRLTQCLMPKSRPMDNMPAGWSVPQEDEVALCIMSQLSAYNMLAFEENLAHSARFYDVRNMTPSEFARWRDTFIHLMKKVTLRNGGKPICLKSPTHTFRVGPLLEMFPKARFVHIHRNPYAVIRSCIHLRKATLAANKFSRPTLWRVEHELCDYYEEAFNCFQHDRLQVPAGQLAEVRFEDLEADPLREMDRIYSELNLSGFENLERAVAPQMAELRNYKKNRFPTRTDEMRLIYERLRFAFEHYDYMAPQVEAGAAA